MSEVSGPVLSLPGSGHTVPDGVMCDNHSDRLAVTRVQGETDSFGAEFHDICKECHDEYKQQMKEMNTSGTCDWCKNTDVEVKSFRDIDEGMSGPVYDVCKKCRDNYNDKLKAELEESGYYDED